MIFTNQAQRCDLFTWEPDERFFFFHSLFLFSFSFSRGVCFHRSDGSDDDDGDGDEGAYGGGGYDYELETAKTAGVVASSIAAGEGTVEGTRDRLQAETEVSYHTVSIPEREPVQYYSSAHTYIYIYIH